MNHEAHLLEKYGRPYLYLKELAAELNMTAGGVQNAIKAGRFAIHTSLDAAGRRVAHVSSLARYYDNLLPADITPPAAASQKITHIKPTRAPQTRKAKSFADSWRSETEQMRAQGAAR